jgi:SAM-dependent methyltransferase
MKSNFEPGSFRDRQARIFYRDGLVLRALKQQALEAWRMLVSTDFFAEFAHVGRIVSTQEVAIDDRLATLLQGDWVGVLKHKKIPFISYFYEWPFGMLKDAALLHLQLLKAAIAEGMILRDSSPFNIQWEGATPVFIDIPSFSRLISNQPWIGYRQFCKMFLYPLFLQAYKGVPPQAWLRGSIDGIEAEHLCRLMRPRDYLRPGIVFHLYLHAKAEFRYGRNQRNVKAELRNAGFNAKLIHANVHRLEKLLLKLSIRNDTSPWSAYGQCTGYDDADRKRKVDFVRRVILSRRRKLVWDFGCNVGTFSRLAAENSQYVVAFDTDVLVIESFYQKLKAENNKRILPLVLDIVNPSPGLGWRGLERKTMRERGTPDLIMCLALIHHIVIGANVPVREFVKWLASFGSDVLIEFVGREDAAVQGLLRNKEDNYADYNEEFFRRCLSGAFELAWRQALDRPRILYYARAKSSYSLQERREWFFGACSP